MNNFTDEWKRLSIKIQSHMNASNMIFNALKINSADNLALQYLIKETHSILKDLKKFVYHDTYLPRHIKSNLKTYLETDHIKQMLEKDYSSPGKLQS